MKKMTVLVMITMSVVLTGCGSLKELKGKYEDKLLERSIEESGVPEMIQNDLNELCDYDSWMVIKGLDGQYDVIHAGPQDACTEFIEEEPELYETLRSCLRID